MARKSAVEERLARLQRLEDDPASAEGRRDLRKALQAASRTMVASAARIVATYQLNDLAPDLEAAFDRFMTNPLRTDKGCIAKLGIVDALDRMDAGGEEVFLKGIRHVQMEPVYGGKADTASNLRGNCGLALAQLGHPEVLYELTTLLMDPEHQARRAAVKALTYLARQESELLLRMKALSGDPEPDVVAECLSGLVEIDAGQSLPFVARFLDGDDPVMLEGAALAMAGSRKVEAFGLLRNCWMETVDQRVRRLLVLPIALTRQDEALEFLFEVIEDAGREMAMAAIEGVGLYVGDADARTRIQEIVDARDDPAVTGAWAEVCGDE
ncbi:MAG: hypothetical protein GWP08_15945 [Nitrospiraceae bacterium]|nr:hypothetical protein [Nitrospiraceae bacterium]